MTTVSRAGDLWAFIFGEEPDEAQLAAGINMLAATLGVALAGGTDRDVLEAVRTITSARDVAIEMTATPKIAGVLYV